jgi:ribosomal protein L18E
MLELGEAGENLAASLRPHGVTVAFQLVDGTVARNNYAHDGQAPVISDVETTLSVAKRSGKMIQVDSIDDDCGYNMDLFIVPSQVVAVKVEKVFDVVGVVG